MISTSSSPMAPISPTPITSSPISTTYSDECSGSGRGQKHGPLRRWSPTSTDHPRPHPVFHADYTRPPVPPFPASPPLPYPGPRRPSRHRVVMSEYWKSTPSYWCKFCSHYVRDTGLERRNHESSIKHQNNIQRSLRELHKGQERDAREKQRAKDEVARLNGLVGGGAGAGRRDAPPATTTTTTIAGVTSNSGARHAVAAPASGLPSAAQRKAHAEQLAAMGIELPDELKEEVSGVGGWKVLSEKVVDVGEGGEGGRSLAGIKREAKDEEDKDAVARGVRKRRAEGEDEDELREGDGGGGAKRKAWGSSFKTYPGANKGGEDAGDLDALLGGVAKKRDEVREKEGEVKEKAVEGVKEEQGEEQLPIAAIPAADPSSNAQGDDSSSAVVFKKRKGKK